MVPVFFKKLYLIYNNRKVVNFFGSDFSKKVLISYITTPFRKQSLEHSNYFEVMSAANIFDELGYQVDVIHYDSKSINLESYDVIYGFGDVFKWYFESGLVGRRTIYYGTGMHVCHQNSSTLKRVKDVFNKRGVWLAKSSRFVEKTWTHQTSLVDGIIALGNDECKKTYEVHYDGPVIALPAPFYQIIDGTDIIKGKKINESKSFLWFGSSGLIHKGLDLCLDYFSSRPDLTLYICGNIYSEPEFVDEYYNELFNFPNIKVQGFVAIDSPKFKELLQLCSFSILPSCSEGGGVSVLTTVGNGGLIPIVSAETSISTGYEIEIKSLDYKGIEDAIFYAESLNDEGIFALRKNNLKFVINNHNQDVYYSRLKSSIEQVLNNAL